jgi:DNA-binding MarR family transcriptional regulator
MEESRLCSLPVRSDEYIVQAPHNSGKQIKLHHQKHLKELPLSSKIVLEILSRDGAMTHKDIVKRSHCSPRTVRYALKKLTDEKLLTLKMNMQDMRQIVYQYRMTPPPENGIVEI